MENSASISPDCNNQIQFVLDNQIISIDCANQNIKLTTTLLNYLRSLPNHKGVKEGCAEGDCGACTVVIAELFDGHLKYKAINSCLIFLPMIHGKQVITVENLAIKKAYDVKLHPVQQALLDSNGSQCGYCTPGIAMSMFALYKNNAKLEREEIENELTGNLCRCTGYQSIIKAAENVVKNNSTDQFELMEQETIAQLQQINRNPKSLFLSTNQQIYFKPSDLDELLILLDQHTDAILINGSTDIALKQTKRFEHLNKIIDMSAVEELCSFVETESCIEIGAGLSFEEVKVYTKGSLDALHNLIDVFASKQIRNIATIGGNIGTASPISDTLPLLFAYKAKLKLISKNSSRELAIEKFISGYRKTALKRGEIIFSISIPKTTNEIVKFYKVSKRKDLDISTVSAGFRLKLDNGIVSDIILAFGGMAAVTSRAKESEDFLKGKNWNRNNIKKAIEILKSEFRPISDARSEKEFRTLVAGNLLLKFAEEIDMKE